VPDNSNDNPGSSSPAPEACGRAALLLVESLMHVLIDRGVVDLEDAFEAVGVAIDAAIDGADEPLHLPSPTSLTLLAAIRDSLAVDLNGT